MRVWNIFLDLLFPPKCPFCCGVLDDPRASLCPGCQPVLPWLEKKQALRKVAFTAGCYSPLEYRDRVRESIHRFKFGSVRAYAAPFGALMAQCVSDHGEINADLVTWAPLSRKRLRQRGYDQAGLLAREVGERLDLPVVRTLNKNRHTQRQSDLHDHAQRRANVLGAYVLRPGADVRGKRVLLVDDVVTSGATLSSCAKVLHQAGAEEVWCVTLAQAGK